MVKTRATQSIDLTLFRGSPARGKHVWSPFSNKLEARLRFAGVKYTTESGTPKTAPRGKIPYVECRGELPVESIDPAHVRLDSHSEPVADLADTALIIKDLVKWGVLPELNDGLSSEEQTVDLALRSLLEDKIYFYGTREKWMDNYYTMRDNTLAAIPYPIRVIVGFLAQRSIAATLAGQGAGRFSKEEITSFKREGWESISGFLVAAKAKSPHVSKSEPFWALGGSQPTESDATLYGFVSSALVCDAGPETMEIVRGLSVLVDYANRIHARYFPDFEDW